MKKFLKFYLIFFFTIIFSLPVSANFNKDFWKSFYQNVGMQLGEAAQFQPWNFNTQSKLLRPIAGVGQVAIGETTTTTNAALEVKGDVAFTSINGTIQCLQINSSGIVSGTGLLCGSGGGGGSGGFWTTSTNDLVGYPNLNTGYSIVLGRTATSVPSIFQVLGNIFVDSASSTITSLRIADNFTVGKNTLVTNLNADLFDSLDSTAFSKEGSNGAFETLWSGVLHPTSTSNGLYILGSSTLQTLRTDTLTVAKTITLPSDSVTEANINFSTVCASGSHLYVSAGNLACEDSFTGKTTANLSENTNLYYTATRVNDLIDASTTLAYGQCTNGQILKSNGTIWQCSSDNAGSGSAYAEFTHIGSNQQPASTTPFLFPNGFLASSSALFSGGLINYGGASTTNFAITTLTQASCDVKANIGGDLYCGTDATGGSSGSSGAWELKYPNVITPTSTTGGIDVRGASSTVQTLRTDTLTVASGSTFPADDLSESEINFSTVCAAGNHLYVNSGNLACEANTVYDSLGSNGAWETIWSTTKRPTSTTDGIYVLGSSTIQTLRTNALIVANTISVPTDAIAESALNMSTACASGNHLIISGTNFACEDSFTGKTTANLTENTNLYWTQARWDTASEASTTWAGFSSQFKSFSNASTTQTAFKEQWLALANASTTQTAFKEQWLALTNASTTQTAFKEQWQGFDNASTTKNWASSIIASLTATNATSTHLYSPEFCLGTDCRTVWPTTGSTGANGSWQATTTNGVINQTPTSTTAGIILNNPATTTSNLVVGDIVPGGRSACLMIKGDGAWLYCFASGGSLSCSATNCSGSSTTTVQLGQ